MKKIMVNKRGGVLASLIVLVAVLSVFGVALGVVTVTQKKLANNEEKTEQVQLSVTSAADYLVKQLGKSNDPITTALTSYLNTEKTLFDSESSDLGQVTYKVSKTNKDVYVDVKAIKDGFQAKTRLYFTLDQIYEGITVRSTLTLGSSDKTVAAFKDYTYDATTGQWKYSSTELTDTVLDEYITLKDGTSLEVKNATSVPTIPSFSKPSTVCAYNNQDIGTISATCALPSYQAKQEFTGTLTFVTGSTPINVYIPTDFNIRDNGAAGKPWFIVKGSGEINFFIDQVGSDTTFMMPTLDLEEGSTAKVNIYSDDAITITVQFNRANADRNYGAVVANLIVPNANLVIQSTGTQNAADDPNIKEAVVIGNIVTNNLKINLNNHETSKGADFNYYYQQGSSLPVNFDGSALTFRDYRE